MSPVDEGERDLAHGLPLGDDHAEAARLLRRRKRNLLRDALEVAATSALAHPNLLQVGWAGEGSWGCLHNACCSCNACAAWALALLNDFVRVPASPAGAWTAWRPAHHHSLCLQPSYLEAHQHVMLLHDSRYAAAARTERAATLTCCCLPPTTTTTAATGAARRVLHAHACTRSCTRTSPM